RWPYPREATTVLLHTTTTPNHWSIAGGERQRQRRNSVSEVDTVPCARELYRIKDRFSAAAVQAPNSATPDIRPANLALSLPTKAQLCEGPSSSCYWTLSGSLSLMCSAKPLANCLPQPHLAAGLILWWVRQS